MQAVRRIYGPWILSSRLNTEDGRSVGGEADHHHVHQLIAVKDAGAQLEQSGERLAANTVVHLEPGSDECVLVPDRSRFAKLAFCSVFDPLEPGEYPNEAWLHPASMTRQPTSDELWGMALPIVVPREMSVEMVSELLYIAGIWWRNDVGRLEANARLGLVLAKLIRYVSNQQQGDENTFLTEATMVAERLLDRRITMDEIGHHLNISGRMLATKIRAYTGKSGREWLC